MKFFALTFLFAALLATPAFGQISNRENPTCNPYYAKIAVERQVSESRLLEATDKRIKILLRVAEFLWTLDEETARKYFTEAFQTAESRFKDKGYESKTKDGIEVSQPDYRFDVLSAIAEKDAEWAKKLYEKILKEYEESAEKDKRNDFEKNREISDLLAVAARSAKTNPPLALQIARRVMRYELTNVWYFSLYGIARNNQQLADQIYAELLTNYANADVFRLLYLSAYPFDNGRIFGIEKYSLGMSVPPNFTPDKNLQVRFFNTLFRKILALTPENNTKSLQTQMPESAVALTALREVETVVAANFPQLIEIHTRAKTHVGSLVTNETLDSIAEREKWQGEFNMDFDERIRRLEKLDDEGKLRDSDILKLIINLKTDEQYEKAAFWILKMNDANARADTNNLYFFRRGQLAVEENRLNEAQKFAGKLADFERRAILYFQIASNALKKDINSFQSLDVLGDAYKMAEKAENSVGKAQVFLGLANIYAKTDFSRANDSLSNAVKVTNNLENPDIFTISILRQIKVDGLTHFTSDYSPGFDLEETFKTMAEKDFSLTLGQAESFSDKYFRALAVISVVKDCAKPKKQVKSKSGAN